MSTKNFEVLLQKNGRIQWMPVPGCITHSEARSQGEEMYDGNILQTRFSGVDYDDENDDDDGGGGLSGAFGGLVLLAAGAGLILVISMWPIFLIGGIIYGLYKIYKNGK
jgi:hypothetical protein